MLEAFLTYAGLPRQWVAVIMGFLKGPLGFIVGRRVSETYIRSTGGIGQGDKLSPSLLVLLTSILCRKLHMELPECQVFLYADDSMVWVPGTPAEVQAQTLHLTRVMAQYAQFTGQTLNLAKSKAVVQGDWGPMGITQVGGIQLVKAVKYLGWYVGDMGPVEQYTGPMRKYKLKCQQLEMLPLTLEEKAQALATWAYPVFDVVGRMAYPMDKIPPQ